MLFLDTTKVDELELELDKDDVAFNEENLEAAIARMQGLQNQLSKYNLALELKHIGEERRTATYGISNLFDKIKAAINANKRYTVAKQRYNKALEIRAEVDSRLEDYLSLKEYYFYVNFSKTVKPAKPANVAHESQIADKQLGDNN